MLTKLLETLRRRKLHRQPPPDAATRCGTCGGSLTSPAERIADLVGTETCAAIIGSLQERGYADLHCYQRDGVLVVEAYPAEGGAS